MALLHFLLLCYIEPPLELPKQLLPTQVEQPTPTLVTKPWQNLNPSRRESAGQKYNLNPLHAEQLLLYLFTPNQTQQQLFTLFRRNPADS